MIFFSHYPHVRDLVVHYATFFSESEILKQQEFGVKTSQEAEKFSLFIWKMADQMRNDTENNVAVLGSIDNSDMLPDVYYEVSDFMAKCGFEATWERVCNEA